MNPDPMRQLNIWLENVVKSGASEPNAMILSTSDKDGQSHSRVVLAKYLSNNELIFFSNYESAKAQEIRINPRVSGLFFWPHSERQVRFEGYAEKISKSASDQYFSQRPRDSQLSAWVSRQSAKIANRTVLQEKFEYYKKKFADKTIKRPNNWGGYKIIPFYYEFWQGGKDRLHDRFAYRKNQEGWDITRLSP